MPLVKMQTSVECTPGQKEELAAELSSICATVTGKPEAYVAAVVECDAVIAFGGQLQPSAFVEVKSIGGLNDQVNVSLSKSICECIESKLGIPGKCVYINFTDVPPSNWGFDGSTFGNPAGS